MKPLIIQHPEWQSTGQRTLFASITLAFWALWFQLWLPLITFIAWSLGIGFVYEHMVDLAGYRGLTRLLGIYGIVILTMGGSLIGWALYNYLRFRGVERRSARAPVSAEMLASSYRLNPSDLKSWQSARRLVIHQDQHCNIVRIDARNHNWQRKELLPELPVAKLKVRYLGVRPVDEWIGRS